MSSTDKDYIEIVSGVLRKVSETVMGQQNVRYCLYYYNDVHYIQYTMIV